VGELLTDMLQTPQGVSLVMPVMMVIAAITDIRSYKIPNWLTGLTALLFIPAAIISGMPVAVMAAHVATGLILFFVGYGLYALRLFGGGDAKMMAAAGLWLGASQTMMFLILTALAGGALAIVFMVLAAIQLHTEMTDSSFTKSLRKLAPKLPYGVALAIGAILAFPGSWWVQNAL
jgi:prepilin peptidase CpaA